MTSVISCVCVCPRSKRKTAGTIDTKVGTDVSIAAASRAKKMKTKRQRSRSHGYERGHSRTLCSKYRSTLLPQSHGYVWCAAAAGMGLTARQYDGEGF